MGAFSDLGRLKNGSKYKPRHSPIPKTKNREQEIRTIGELPHTRFLPHIAEETGFEPAIPCGIHAFQASAFDRSATPPQYEGLQFALQPLTPDRYTNPPSALETLVKWARP